MNEKNRKLNEEQAGEKVCVKEKIADNTHKKAFGETGIADVPDTVALSSDRKAIITFDQTKLPGQEVFIELKTQNDVWDAIYMLKVRGAPAIGVCAAYGIYLAAAEIYEEGVRDFDGFYEKFKAKKAYLAGARPTAVNLFWALSEMEKVVLANRTGTVEQIVEALYSRAEEIKNDDIERCKAIGEYGLPLLHEGCGVLTHCNAGRLATVRYGTALSPLYLAKERGMNFRVYSDETRPLHQGSRLTCYELNKAGIDVTLLCDNMASYAMKQGLIDICFVGADRIAANGDFANKIGTSGVAIMAKYYGIPFYTLAPLSTLDINTATGKDIIIEQRKQEEVKEKWFENPMAPEGVKALNPAFDVTDHELLSGIITEKGIIRPPFDVNIRKLIEKTKK